MPAIAPLSAILGMALGGQRQLVVVGQRFQAVLRPFLVDELPHLVRPVVGHGRGCG